MSNIFDIESVKPYLNSIKGKRIVLTNGCFDLLHPGHIDYLTKAKALGDILIIGLNSDPSVQALKGPSRPINNQDFRSIMLLALKPVDAVVLFDEDTPISLIHTVQPSVHVKGGDYIAEELPEYEAVVSNGGEVQILSFLDGFSSTSIINEIKRSV